MSIKPRKPTEKKSPVPLIFSLAGMIVFGIGIDLESAVGIIIGAVLMMIALIPILAKGTKS